MRGWVYDERFCFICRLAFAPLALLSTVHAARASCASPGTFSARKQRGGLGGAAWRVLGFPWVLRALFLPSPVRFFEFVLNKRLIGGTLTFLPDSPARSHKKTKRNQRRGEKEKQRGPFLCYVMMIVVCVCVCAAAEGVSEGGQNAHARSSRAHVEQRATFCCRHVAVRGIVCVCVPRLVRAVCARACVHKMRVRVRVHGRALRQERMLLYCCWVVFCVAVRLLEAHPTPKKTHPSRTIDSNHRA